MAWCRTCVDVGSQKAVVVMCVRYCTEVRMEQATEYWRQECLRNSFEMRHVSWCVNWDSCGRPRNRGSTPGSGRSFIALQSAQSSSVAHPAFCPGGTASVWLGIKRLVIGWPFTAIQYRGSECVRIKVTIKIQYVVLKFPLFQQLSWLVFKRRNNFISNFTFTFIFTLVRTDRNVPYWQSPRISGFDPRPIRAGFMVERERERKRRADFAHVIWLFAFSALHRSLTLIDILLTLCNVRNRSVRIYKTYNCALRSMLPAFNPHWTEQPSGVPWQTTLRREPTYFVRPIQY